MSDSGEIAELRQQIEQLKTRLRVLETPGFDRFAQFAVENLSDAAYWMEEDASIVYVNEAASRLTGYSLEELIGMKVYQLNVDLDEFNWPAIWGLLKAKRQRCFEARHRRKDGTILQVEITANFLEFDGTEYSCAFVRDISGRKELESRLRQAEKMDAIGRLAGGVAHDFNNQLSGIMGYTDLIRQAVTDNPKATEYVEKLARVVRVASDLTAQLLAFSHRGKFLVRPVDLHQLIEEVISILSHGIDKRIQIETTLAADPAWTSGDPSQLHNAVLNLALNAADAMPEGGVMTITTANVRLNESNDSARPPGVPPGSYVTLAIRDTGMGMDRETKARAFEPFFTTKDSGAGTGLGLAAVYGTIQNHKGAITVDTEVGHGSLFTLYLPTSQPRSRLERDTDEPSTLRLHGHVLVVDDEPAPRDVAARMLESLGCTVTSLGDGESALSFLEDQGDSVDLVLLDMVMPGMNGADTFAAMKQLTPDVQVLMMSGYSMDGQAQSMIDAGAKGFLQKPFAMAALAAAVGAILQR